MVGRKQNVMLANDANDDEIFILHPHYNDSNYFPLGTYFSDHDKNDCDWR